MSKIYNVQISLHEWFERIVHADAQELKQEDYKRQSRLEILNRITGLPYDKPEIFDAIELVEQSTRFTKFFTTNKERLCRIRLVPLSSELPKLRTIGKTIQESVKWFHEQQIDPTQYKVHFFQFSDNTLWSTIFVINSYGIFGEIVQGGHNQLTQGFHEHKPITFSYDFFHWYLSEPDSEVQQHLEEIISYLYVPDESMQQKLHEQVDTNYSHNYIQGYFETVQADTIPLQFIDFNRVLGKLYEDFIILEPTQDNISYIVKGQTGCPGIVTGRVRIVNPEEISQITLMSDEILVCDMTSPEYVPLMKQCAGIITDRGGILSHAAIISRELKKPCVVGTGNASKILTNAQKITLDAIRGTII